MEGKKVDEFKFEFKFKKNEWIQSNPGYHH